MKISMIGAGYVGLVSGACFAEFGADVVCLDVDAAKIEALTKGVIPLYEPELEELVRKNAAAGRLHFSVPFDAHIPQSDFVFIAVGTPQMEDGHADLAHVYAAVRKVAVHLRGYTVVVGKSTAPMGTIRNVGRIIAETNPEAGFDVASNPEFLRQGDAVADFMHPDRVVIGVESERAEKLLLELYRPFYLNEVPFLITSLESAELIKYAANAFLATKISFINEIAMLCESSGADVEAVSRGMGLDRRIGLQFLRPSPGYGGSCFPKDTRALVKMAQKYDVSSRIVDATIGVNAAQPEKILKKIQGAFPEGIAGKSIAVLGLTFKPETDDVRDSVALSILPSLLELGTRIYAHDPKGMDKAARVLPDGIVYRDDPYKAIEQSDAVIVLTEWNAFRSMDLQRIRGSMQGNTFIDLRNIYKPDRMKELGFEYYCIGRQAP